MCQIFGGDFVFYDNLNKLCKEQGTSVTAIIKDIGLNPTSGTYWKKGSFPSGDILIKLSERLNASIDYLLTGKEKSAKSSLTEMEIEALAIFKKLTTKDQLKFIGRMEQQYEEYATPPMAFAARSAGPENTNCRPQIDTAKADYLDCSIDYLLDRTDNPTSHKP